MDDFNKKNTDQKNYWFPAKKYGFGWGFPIAWQGWVVFVIYLLVVLGASILLSPSSLIYSLVIIFATVILILIMIKTGEPARWRWGNGTTSK